MGEALSILLWFTSKSFLLGTIAPLTRLFQASSCITYIPASFHVSEIINQRNEENCELSDVSLSENSESTSSGESLCDSIEIEDENNKENYGTEPNSDDNGDTIFFKDLYHQYKNDKKEKLETQLLEVRRQKHNLYQGLLEERVK